jgi:glucose-1-phosphate thymidylyltransferase
MKCVLLAAGFATRLYPLTLNTPKPLLDVAGKPILDRLMEKIREVPEVGEVLLVTNGKFFHTFNEWAYRQSSYPLVTVLNDGTLDNEHRLGAIVDLAFAVREQRIEEDTLVLAGDNLFDFSLKDFSEFFYAKGTDCITTHQLNDTEQLKRTGVIEVDPGWRVLSFQEKPRAPRTSYAVPPIYLYRWDTLPLLEEYLQAGMNPDAPGSFIPWLLERKTVHAYFFAGSRYDIGTRESYEEVCRIYQNRGVD